MGFQAGVKPFCLECICIVSTWWGDSSFFLLCTTSSLSESLNHGTTWEWWLEAIFHGKLSHLKEQNSKNKCRKTMVFTLGKIDENRGFPWCSRVLPMKLLLFTMFSLEFLKMTGCCYSRDCSFFEAKKPGTKDSLPPLGGWWNLSVCLAVTSPTGWTSWKLNFRKKEVLGNVENIVLWLVNMVQHISNLATLKNLMCLVFGILTCLLCICLFPFPQVFTPACIFVFVSLRATSSHLVIFTDGLLVNGFLGRHRQVPGPPDPEGWKSVKDKASGN